MNLILEKELELIAYVRHSVLKLTDGFSVEQMNRIPDKMKNNLVWNLGHMIFTQQMLCYGLGGLKPAIDTAYFAEFAPDTLPARHIGQEEIFRIRTTFEHSFECLVNDVEANNLDGYKPWKLPTGIAIDTIYDAMATNAIHEGRHFGVVISLAKLVD